MQETANPIVKDLVLIGGGHTHAIALRMFGMQPLPGVRITLITEASDTPYSGMLPGHVAGFYTHEECHIDLRPLAQFAGAQLYLDRAVGLDLQNQRVLCENRPPVTFDLLSIDIGSTPKPPCMLGDLEAIIPAKPVRRFLERWEQLTEQVALAPDQSLCIGIVGGGAGGVELALTVHHRLQEILRQARQPLANLTLHLFHRDAELMSKHNACVRQHFRQLLSQRGIHLHLSEEVYEVQADRIVCKSGLQVACDTIFWVTQASAPDWIEKSGLQVDADGFVLVDDTMRSLSHPQVFAAGDIATMVNHPRPKAGVFAVRQGKPLFKNLRSALQGQPLQPFQPQMQYLSLIGTGDGEAVASRGNLFWRSPWLWQWKDYIDRAFMQRFSQLPDSMMVKAASQEAVEFPATESAHPSVPAMYCAGCGSKVGSTTLERALQRVKQNFPAYSNRSDILIGLDAPDDAAVVQIPVDQVLVQTIDYFTALINDPFIFGQIAANHALSDLFAMGAQPQSALAIATIPYAQSAQAEETLYQLLSGAMRVLQQANAELTGGHTVEGRELAFGLSCNGLAHPDRLLRKGGMQPEQRLILTKPIGTGTLFAAHMRLQAKGRWIDEAIASMLLSNQQAAQCLLEHQASACTDITGFGLIGHLLEMVRASGVAVQLDLEKIPLLDGAIETVQKGVVSSLQPQNLQAAGAIANLSEAEGWPQFPLLFDPQTSGGLLAAVPVEQVDRCLTALNNLGYCQSAVIGYTSPLTERAKPITIAL